MDNDEARNKKKKIKYNKYNIINKIKILYL